MRRVKGKKCRNLTEVINKVKEKKRIRRLKQSTGKKRMLNGSEEIRRSEYSRGVVKELNARGVCSAGVKGMKESTFSGDRGESQREEANVRGSVERSQREVEFAQREF